MVLVWASGTPRPLFPGFTWFQRTAAPEGGWPRSRVFWRCRSSQCRWAGEDWASPLAAASPYGAPRSAPSTLSSPSPDAPIPFEGSQSVPSFCFGIVLLLPCFSLFFVSSFLHLRPSLSWWPAASSPASPGNAAGRAWCPADGSPSASADQWAWWPRCPPAGPGWAGSPPPAKGQVFVPASCPTRPPPPLWGQRRREREERFV